MNLGTIVAVFAHPDDESLACGGTLARLADGGTRVVLVCASRGERGALDGVSERSELGALRGSEMRAAAEALGISELVMLDHTDGFLRWARQTELVADIHLAVSVHRPSAVITFGSDGLYWHPDHIGIYDATTAAIQAFGGAAPAMYCVTMPLGAVRGMVDAATALGWTPPTDGFWSLQPDAFGLHAAPPEVIVDVAPWVARKVRALHCHRSQMGAADPLSLIDRADASRWLGVEHFHRARISNGSHPPLLERLGRA